MKRIRLGGVVRSGLPIAVATVLLVMPGPALGDLGGALGGPSGAGVPSLEDVRHLNRVGPFGDAERAARACLKEAERVHGPESPEVAEVLDELSVALRRTGQIAEPEALEACQRAVRIKERAFGKKDARYAASLYHLGLLHYNRKDYTRALGLLEETLEVRQSALGSNHPDVAKSLLALGSVNYALRNIAEASSLTERGVAIEKAALGAADPERAYGLNSLGTLRFVVGDYSAAIPLFEEAIALWERSPTPNEAVIADCRFNLAVVLGDMGDHARAAENLERVLRQQRLELGEDHPTVAMTLTALAEEIMELGDLTGAKARLRRADRILEARAPRDSDRGWVRAKLGWLYLEEGDLDRAAEAFRLALRDQEGLPGSAHPSRWLCLRGMAMVTARRGEPEGARRYYEQTVDLVIRTLGPRNPDLGRVLPEYAAFQLSARDSVGALKTALWAADLNRERSRLTARGASERQALLYASNLDTGLDVAFAALSGTLRSGSDGAVRRVWDALIRSRALVLDEVAERARLVEGAGDVVEVAKRLEGARSRLANLLVRGPSGERTGSGESLVVQAREEVERCERDLAARSASFGRSRAREAIGLDEVLAALPRGSGLLSFASYGNGRARSYMAFAAGVDRTPWAVSLGSADEIDMLIDRWRKLAGQPPTGGTRDRARAEAACRAAGRALRARIWDPVSSPLDGAKLVLVVPDGPIHLLNLAALPESGTGYLIESPHVIHYLSAERDIASLESIPSHGVGLLALGAAAFDREEKPVAPDHAPSLAAIGPAASPYREALGDCRDFRSVRFEPLPETNAEVDEIAKLWGRPDEVLLLKGESAGEHSVKELVSGKRVAHFATHGFFLGGRCGGAAGGKGTTRGIGGIASVGPAPTAAPPAASTLANPFLLSGLALTGANRRSGAGLEEEDGILTADEIASLDLSGLEWVVLSACDTGTGDVRSGEGVLGLRRAFQIAGAGTLIMSLWPVEDQSTRDWMTSLYQGRFRGNLETAEAVREAHLGALRSLRARGLSTHPFYWAAFVATGDWR